MSAPLLRVEDLAVSFASAGGARAQAVAGVSLTVHAGQTVALVGESGCGKSVTALSLLQLLPSPPARIDRGRALLNVGDGPTDLLSMGARAIRRVRGGSVAMIFQEPMTSLNPVLTVGQQVVEAIRLHRRLSRRGARERAAEALERVGIALARERLGAYPHEFSGGMRQRVMIAMALACEPALLLADEPTTALDVTIQAQILELIDRLRRERTMGVLLITHDLGVVAEHADVICVMYAGRVMEYGRTREVLRDPLHPYTKGLLGSVPRMSARAERLAVVRRIMEDDAVFERPVEGGGAPAWRPSPVGGADAPVELRRAGASRWVACVADRATETPVVPDVADRPLVETGA